MGLAFEAGAVLTAFAITAVFVVWPSPLMMVLFTFVGVPLFLITAAFFVGRVVRELRTKDVL